MTSRRRRIRVLKVKFVYDPTHVPDLTMKHPWKSGTTIHPRDLSIHVSRQALDDASVRRFRLQKIQTAVQIFLAPQ